VKVKVLSLFDGMSCGQIALNRIGITPDAYYASELDKYAIKVTQENYPDTVQLGDVTGWRDWDIDWASIDLLIGGSPCQGFSFAGKQLAFDDPRSKLFFVYVDILNHIKSVNPNVKFMLENVKMKKEYLAVISEQLGVEPVFINSALVSAQNRQRYYWCNWEVIQPEDKGTVLADILEDEGQPDMVINQGMECQKENIQKSHCLMARDYKGFGNQGMTGVRNLPPGRYVNGKEYRKLTPIECERLQTVPDNYTNHVSNTQRYKMLGNGWTVDVVAHIFREGLL
jgi:site-specific DNA-cytosine methylase